MTKRPDGCRPAACTSNPAARASSRNSAWLRSLPPTKTIISKDGDGPQSSSGDNPAEDDDTTRGTCRLGAAPQDGHRLAIGPVAQHVFQQIEIGPGWQRVEEALPHRSDTFGHAGNLKDLNGSSHGRREIDQRAPAWSNGRLEWVGCSHCGNGPPRISTGISGPCLGASCKAGVLVDCHRSLRSPRFCESPLLA